MWKFLKRLVLVLLALGVAATIAAAIYLRPFYLKSQAAADAVDLAELDRIPAITEVFDASGMSYGRLPGEVRYVVPLAEISPNFVHAVMAREDSRFYEHHGVDFLGIARAAVRNLRAGGVREGASTLTQQLARNTFDLGENRWRRKAVEALLAWRIERNFNKGQIFEAYANRIYYGVGIYGVETAARACFGKSAKDLTLSEAAILAGLIRSPNRLSPLEDSRTALAQRDQVLARMTELKMITAAEAQAARAETIPAGKRQAPRVQQNYAMDAVVRDLDILLPNDVVDRGGLKIFTTIDRRLQLLAETAVDEKLTTLESEKDWPHATRAAANAAPATGAPKPADSPYIQGALVAIDNQTGGIRAVVGGRDFHESPYNRAIFARRQIGSTFKPFVYAAAFSRGLLPGTLVDDAPLREGEVAGLRGTWSPENSDNDDLGMQPAAIGLIRSRNTMTIRIGEMAGRAAVRELALKAGLERVPDVPSIYLGAFETTLKSLTAAYTMFPNGGVRRQPFIIDHIVDRHGRTIYKATHAELACLSPSVDFIVSGLLEDVVTKGTAASAEKLGLTLPAAGKTGTTDDYKDAWFVGYTTRLTCGVWVGMDRPERIVSHGYGSALALPIWVAFMQKAAEWKYDAAKFASATDLRSVELCRDSGGVATDACRAAGTTYAAGLPMGLIPDRYCAVHAGSLAGMSTAPPALAVAPAYPPTAPAVPFAPRDPTGAPIPVARAVAASATPAQATSEAPANANYEVIRTQEGLQFIDR